MASLSRHGRWGRGFLAALLSVGMVAAAPGPAVAQGAEPLPTAVGRVALVDGEASFREAQRDPWTAGVANTPVIAGSSLWTQPSSRAALEIAAGRFWLDGGTEVDITRLDDRQVMLGLPQGRLDVSLGGLRPGDSYVVVTPAGSVVLEAAGFYRITAGDQNNASSVAVFSGRADFSSAGGTQTVEGGQEAFAAGGPSQLDAASEDSFDRWVEGQDGEDYGRVSRQYVPSGIPGTSDLDAYGQWRDVPDYGTVWVPTQVPADWQPYRDGHWQWIDPWGWTWVDNAPWGFAPFHYGRWVNLNGWWSWVPGGRSSRPLYAPALVSFVGDPGTIVDGGGPCVGWLPLGPGEIYRPNWVGLGLGGGVGLALTFDYFRRMNPDIREDRLARFDDRGRFRDRDGDGDRGERFVNRNYVTVVNRNTFLDARPVRDGLRPTRPGADIRGAFNPAQASLPTTPTRESHGDWHGVSAPPSRPSSWQGGAGGVLPVAGAAAIGRVGQPPAPVQILRGGLGTTSPVGGVNAVGAAPQRLQMVAPLAGQTRQRPEYGGGQFAPVQPLRPVAPLQMPQQMQRQNFGGVGAVGAPPAPIRPVAPITPVRPIVTQPAYHPQQYQQPQFQQQFQQQRAVQQPAYHPPQFQQQQFQQPQFHPQQFQQQQFHPAEMQQRVRPQEFHPSVPRAITPQAQQGGVRRQQ